MDSGKHNLFGKIIAQSFQVEPLTHQLKIVRYDPVKDDQAEVELTMSRLMSEGWKWESSQSVGQYLIYTLTMGEDSEEVDYGD